MDDLFPGLEPVDFTLGTDDNSKQHDEDEIIIKVNEQERLNDPACQHVPKLEGDRIGDTVSVTCEICPYGWYIPTDEAIVLFPDSEFATL